MNPLPAYYECVGRIVAHAARVENVVISLISALQSRSDTDLDARRTTFLLNAKTAQKLVRARLAPATAEPIENWLANAAVLAARRNLIVHSLGGLCVDPSTGALRSLEGIAYRGPRPQPPMMVLETASVEMLDELIKDYEACLKNADQLMHDGTLATVRANDQPPLMEQEPPLELVQRHVAWTAVAGTTLRNMVPAGGRKKVCAYLANLPLAELEPGAISYLLDRWTAELAGGLDGRWGPSRKALNLFLREALADRRLCAKFKLARVQHLLETPLDNRVMAGLDRHCPGRGLTVMRVVQLTSDYSRDFQAAAEALGQWNGIARVHLDL